MRRGFPDILFISDALFYVFAFDGSRSCQVVHLICFGSLIIFTPLTCVFFAIMHRPHVSVSVAMVSEFLLQISQEKDDFSEGLFMTLI